MDLSRLRRWTTARLSEAALRSARWLSPRMIGRLEAGLALLGPRLPVIARIAADNMRAAGVFRPATHTAYFEQIARHLSAALLIWRTPRSADGKIAPAIRQAMEEAVELDDSVGLLTERARRGGVVLIGPHITNFLLITPFVSQRVPLTVYLRYSKDARRRSAKEHWARAVGVGTIVEPASATDPASRFARMVAAIRAGQTLYITPDLPQKRGAGRAVRLCGFELDLPGGAALLAARTGAPVVLMSADRGADSACAARSRTRIVFRALADDGRARGGRARAAEIQECYAAALECFLREQTPRWFFWCDKRWSRVFRGDPRFSMRLPRDAPAQPNGAP